MAENTRYFQEYINRIRSRLVNQNKNWLAIICGDTGSGKSYSALALADMISPRGITVKRNVVFNPIEFLEKLNQKGLEKGDILIFDEAGVGMSSREWYSVQNKLLGVVLQTFRNLNIGVIFTTPSLSFIDIQARKLFHSYFETKTINYRKGKAYLKAFRIQHNSKLGKDYYKHPRTKDQNGKTIVMKYLALSKPRQQLIEEYEEVKTEFTRKLNSDVLKELVEKQEHEGKTKRQIKREQKREEDKKIRKEIEKNPDKFINENRGRKYIDKDLIRVEYGISHHRANTIKKLLEKTMKLN